MPRDEITLVGDYLWDRAYAREVDRLSSSSYLIPANILMENAGKGVAEAVREVGVDDTPVIVLAGSGNNGGDALVAARYLAEAGCEVHVYLVWGDGAQPSPLCAEQMRILTALGHELKPWRAGVLTRFAKSEPIVIDGVLGIGCAGALAEDSPLFRALTEAAGLRDVTVVAVDVPSGLDADTGDRQQVPLDADITITFGGYKPAHLLAPARDLCGEVIVLDIGFPAAARDAALAVHKPLIVRPEPAELVLMDPWEELPRSANKYDRGHVLVIGGSPGKTGAPLLAAMSALRAGSGWASVAMPQSATATLRGEVPREIVFEGLFDGEQLNALKLERFLAERKVRAVVVGPGCMQSPLSPDTATVLSHFTGERGGFVVVDAGATQGLAALVSAVELTPETWVATPHPGEWSRLGPEFDFTPLSPSGVKQAAALAERLGIALLYKGATPLLLTGNPQAPAFVVAEGTVALARAGSGDVLAGVIGAHGAAGLASSVAALRSQVAVAWAARLASEQVGKQAVLARDVMAQLGHIDLLLDAGGDEMDEDDDLGDDD